MHLLAEQLSTCWIDGIVHAADSFPYGGGYKRVAAPTDICGFPKHKEKIQNSKFILILICCPSSKKKSAYENRHHSNSTAGQIPFAFAI